MTIGERIKEIRKNKRLTQKQVGDRCGMADSAIRKYESGLITPKVETVKRLAEALDVPFSSILDLGDERYTEQLMACYPNAPVIEYGDKIRIPLESHRAGRLRDMTKSFDLLDETGQHLAVCLLQILKELSEEGQNKIVDSATIIQGNPSFQKSKK